MNDTPHPVRRDQLALLRAAAYSAAADLVRRQAGGVNRVEDFHDQLDACVAPFGATGAFDGRRIVLTGLGAPIPVPIDLSLAEALTALEADDDDGYGGGTDEEIWDDGLEDLDGEGDR